MILGKNNNYEMAFSKRWNPYVSQENIYKIIKEKNRDFKNIGFSSKICEKNNLISLINFNRHDQANWLEISLVVKKSEKFLMVERFIGAPIVHDKIGDEIFYKIKINLCIAKK
jgi:hypothetical protein